MSTAQSTEPTSNPTILFVDDEDSIRTLVLRVLERGGYNNVITAASSDEAIDLLATVSVDLVLTDMQMPGGSGLELLHHIHETIPGVATLMVTVIDDPALAHSALLLGSYGYIIKPFRQSELLIGVSNALRRRELEIENQDQRDHLEESVKLRSADLWAAIVKLEHSENDVRTSRTETIERLAIAAEFRDEDTGFHVARMSRYTEILAKRCADEELCQNVREASSLHDVGKIGIPDSILLKPEPLTHDERVTIQEHPVIGHRILAGSESPLLKLAADIALTHHEWVDGSGYPNRLTGDEIPLAGRIAAIADVFDALTSNRVYRKAFPLVEAVEMMKKESGTHFDPDLLATFWDALPEVLEVEHEYGSKELHPEVAVVRVPKEATIGGPS
jgi:putative two-component system response regulator